MANLRQPRPADRDPPIGEALVLAIKRQVVGELVNQETGDETDVGAAAFNDASRRTRADDVLCRLELDHRPPVLENDIAPRALGKPEAVLVADDVKVLRRQTQGFRCGQFDDLDRHSRLVEEGHALVATIGLLRGRTPGVGGNKASARRGRRAGLRNVNDFAQTHLMRIAGQYPLFALLPENLTLEPVDLVFGCGQFAAQIDDLLRPQGGGFVKAENV